MSTNAPLTSIKLPRNPNALALGVTGLGTASAAAAAMQAAAMPSFADGIAAMEREFELRGTDEDREWLIGNTVHVSAVKRCLQDLSLTTKPFRPAAKLAPEVVDNNLLEVLQTAWAATNAAPLRAVPEDDLRPTKKVPVPPGNLQPDIPIPAPSAEPPPFLPPDCRKLHALQFIHKIWNLETRTPKCTWPTRNKEVPPSISSCYKHMRRLGRNFPRWLEARLRLWEKRAKRIRRHHPDWRQDLKKEVRGVLPPDYHPVVHEQLLRAAGADTDVSSNTSWKASA